MVTESYSIRPYAGGAVRWAERFGLPANLDIIRVELFFYLSCIRLGSCMDCLFVCWVLGLVTSYCALLFITLSIPMPANWVGFEVILKSKCNDETDF